MSTQTSDHILRTEDLRKSFGEKTVLCGVDLAVPRGSIYTVLGPSGTGKSVLLKCLAGVLKPDSGRVFFDGNPLDHGNSASRTDFRKRSSVLFQSNALFDSLSSLENVMLPLEQTTRLPLKEIRERGMEALHRLELENHRDLYPGQLSGGLQKRLALARAIVTEPEIVLFDEPTAGLDPLRRNAVFTMIAKYQRRFSFTALIVTHDVPEALETSDRVALLQHGRIFHEGTPRDFSLTDLPEVASFRDSRDALRISLASVRETGHFQSTHT